MFIKAFPSAKKCKISVGNLTHFVLSLLKEKFNISSLINVLYAWFWQTYGSWWGKARGDGRNGSTWPLVFLRWSPLCARSLVWGGRSTTCSEAITLSGCTGKWCLASGRKLTKFFQKDSVRWPWSSSGWEYKQGEVTFFALILVHHNCCLRFSASSLRYTDLPERLSATWVCVWVEYPNS